MTPTNSNSDDALAALLDPTRDVLDLPPDVVSDAKTLGRLSALCELHDWRTQFYLSKYRMAAANRLLQLASSADDGGDARAREAQRKACVDALRLNVASLARPGRWTDRRDRDGPQRL